MQITRGERCLVRHYGKPAILVYVGISQKIMAPLTGLSEPPVSVTGYTIWAKYRLAPVSSWARHPASSR